MLLKLGDSSSHWPTARSVARSLHASDDVSAFFGFRFVLSSHKADPTHINIIDNIRIVNTSINPYF